MSDEPWNFRSVARDFVRLDPKVRSDHLERVAMRCFRLAAFDAGDGLRGHVTLSGALVFIAALVPLNRVVRIHLIPSGTQPFPVLRHDLLQAVRHVLPASAIQETIVSKANTPDLGSTDDGNVRIFDTLPVADLDLPTHLGEHPWQSHTRSS